MTPEPHTYVHYAVADKDGLAWSERWTLAGARKECASLNDGHPSGAPWSVCKATHTVTYEEVK